MAPRRRRPSRSFEYYGASDGLKNGLLKVMRAMFNAAPPEFEVVMANLAEAERTLNASGTS